MIDLILMWRRNLLRQAGLVLAAIVTAVVFFLFGVLFRVLLGPVSLGPLNSKLRSALKEQVPGLQLKFDEAALEWSRDEGRINLVIFGTRVFDRGGRIIAQAPEAEIGLAAGPFLAGKIVIHRITLVGVQLTLVHTRAGDLRLGVERDQTHNDILEEIEEALARHSASTPSALKSFSIHRARLAFLDETTGLFIVAPEAEMQLANGTQGPPSSVKAAVDAWLEISGKPAHLIADLVFPRKGNSLNGDFSLTGLSTRALASNTRMFASLARFAMTADVSGSFALERGTKLRYADLGIGATGVVSGFGPPIRVKSVRLVGRYDGLTKRFLIDDADLQSEQLRAHMSGNGILGFDTSGTLASAAFTLAVDKLATNVPRALPEAVKLEHAQVRGVFLAPWRQLMLDQVVIAGGPLSASLAGTVDLADGRSPGIGLNGRIAALGVRDLLRFWPGGLGPGAREWVDRNISSGRIGPLSVHTAIPVGALDKPALPDAAVSVAFPISEATVTYIRGLLPLTYVEGMARLSGDTFKAEIVSALAGSLRVTHAAVSIPNLHVHGMIGEVKAHAEGSLRDSLILADMKPLQYASRFHINPDTTRGEAALDLDFRVPMIRNLGVNNIGISIKATVSALSISLGKNTRVTDGLADFDVDNSRLHAKGNLSLGSTRLAVDWLENFKSAPTTTHLTVKGDLDDDARAAFDLHTEQILSGPVGVVAQLDGYRGAIDRAQIDADLTRSGLSIDYFNLKKPAGAPASAQITARLGPGGSLRSADLNVSGSQLSAKGTVSFGPSGELQRLDLSSVRDGGLNDFALAMSENPSSGMDLTITGHSADGTALGRKSTRASGTNRKTETDEPFHVSARLDHLAMRDGVTMAPFALDVAGVGQHPKTLALSAMLSNSAQVTASIANSDSGRKIAIASNDAGQLLKGLFGFDSIKGGQLSVSATMPPLNAGAYKEVEFSGQAVLREFTVVNQAFLTRIFSSGSLVGFIDLMRGQGIAVDALLVPFKMSGDVIDIHDARASGPSIGITTDGYVDRANDQLALKGAIAPLYGINGFLGAIPVLGNVFVSKQGEGMFGVTYQASGNADEPQVVVNPLAMLAPGILRRIFEGAAPSAPATQTTAASSKPH